MDLFERDKKRSFWYLRREDTDRLVPVLDDWFDLDHLTCEIHLSLSLSCFAFHRHAVIA
jgi:hypothetical protein